MKIILRDVLTLARNGVEPEVKTVSKIQTAEPLEGVSVVLYSLNDEDTELVLKLKIDEAVYYNRLSLVTSGSREELLFLFDPDSEKAKSHIEAGNYQLLDFGPEINDEDTGIVYHKNSNSDHLGGILTDRETVGGKVAFRLRLYEQVNPKPYTDFEVACILEKAINLNQIGGGLVQMFKAYTIQPSDIEIQ